MTSILSVSSAELSHRRKTLRRQRRRQLVCGIWRIVAISSLAGGLSWVATQPVWVIKQPEQINIEGNQILSDRGVRSLLSLSYPQSLLRIEPKTVAQQLETKQTLIAKASVSRQLFPPSLTVKVEEREPVVTAVSVNPSTSATPQLTTPPTNQANPTDRPEAIAPPPPPTVPVGLIDAQGTWIPIENYNSAGQPLPLPPLRIIGDRQQYLPHWSQMYQILRRSPIKVSEIDWQNPANVILKTDIGTVHLGIYGSQFADQLAVLDQMRQLSKEVNGHPIAYIDLTDPNSPAVQLQYPTNQLQSESAKNLQNLKIRSQRTPNSNRER
ncbi:cell division protein FtsQ/DivIB [Aerosakkonemataceae cyanobacterium BLCC-F154]|uniref:Cell division protein FtsQ/DivIB n=1 Tax=Floridaenema fluviatile BLCC-F154 TaxID=3153640 RepID=A0ABV4YGR0_9CYAN